MLNDVDIVVLWVDGNDPEWLEEKAEYKKADDDPDSGLIINRFRDWGLMKYWFRAVENYAPWVRKIHFVTWGHLPDFLDVSNEKLHIVNHKDFMPEGSLPTYNSKALEMNVWRIEDLSERFLFLNDDMFFCNYTSAEDFFDPTTGLPKMVYQEIPVRFKGVGKDWQISSSQNLGLINQNFDKRKTGLLSYPGKQMSMKYPFFYNIRSFFSKILFPEYYVGFKNFHVEGTFLKSTFKEIWEKEEECLTEVTYHRFRRFEDVNQWLAMWWQLADGKFVPKKQNCEYFEADEKTIEKICETVRTRSKQIICINDTDDLGEYEHLSEKIKEAYEQVLPNKSSFELPKSNKENKEQKAKNA